MSVLEFVSSLKWPVVVLLMLIVIARGVKRSPGLGEWARAWLDSRDVRGKIGPTEFEATASQAQAAAQIAVASDEDLAALADPERQNPDDAIAPEARKDVTALRREAVEEVMRQAAQWGWSAAKAGYVELPRSSIQWNEEGRPTMKTKPTVKDVRGRLLKLLEQNPAFQTPLEQLLRDMQRRREEAEQPDQEQPPE